MVILNGRLYIRVTVRMSKISSDSSATLMSWTPVLRNKPRRISLPMVLHLLGHATGTGLSPLINIAGRDDNRKRSQELYLRIWYSVFNGLFLSPKQEFSSYLAGQL